MHKMVNGIKIELSPEEEEEILAEWEQNKRKKMMWLQEQEKKLEIKKSAIDKLFSTANLTEEEKQILQQQLL